MFRQQDYDTIDLRRMFGKHDLIDFKQNENTGLNNLESASSAQWTYVMRKETKMTEFYEGYDLAF